MRYVRYTYPVGQTAYSSSRNVWEGLDQEVNRLFQTVATSFASENAFPVDVYSDKENVFVRAELPGVARDALQVELTDDQLTIGAARKNNTETEGENQSFTRTLTISERVQADKVTASYVDGVLTVTLPKVEEVKPRKIEVNVS